MTMDDMNTMPSGDTPLMWLTRGRVLYAGLVGRLSVRRLGGLTIYLSREAPIRMSLADGPWESGHLFVVPPYMPHRITSDDRHVIDFVVEPERLEPRTLPEVIRGRVGRVDGMTFVTQVRQTVAWLERHASTLPIDDAAFDHLFFGGELPGRPTLDPRIVRVLDDIAADPCTSISAETYARRECLSFSRFVHLFKDEVGVPLRTFRTWKRARGLLRHVTQEANLADIAQHAGYPDSAHFSRSVRQVFGMTPSAMFAGSRRLRLHGGEPLDARMRRHA